MIREISTVELVDGGSVIRQGEFFRLGYLPRDANGEPVNLVNKDITVAIMKRGQIVYEKDVEFDPGDGLIHLVVNENIGNGRMWLEFTATDPNFPTYRRKFPSRQETAVLDIIPGAEDLDFVGVSGMTVEKLQAEQASRQQAFEAEIVPQVEEFKQRVEDGIGAFTEDTEVLDARMGEQNLRAFNQKVTAQLAENLQDANEYILYTFFKSGDDFNTSLFVSSDGENIKKINSGNLNLANLRDPSNCYFEGWFLIAYTGSNPGDFKISRSRDLKNWTTHDISLGFYQNSYNKIWAPEFFVDDEKLYILLSNREGNDIVDINGSTIPAFRTYITECTDVESLTFSAPTKLTLEESNKIDPCLTKHNGEYYIFIKDEYDKKIESWKSNTLTGVYTKVSDNIEPLFNTEGLSITKYKNTFYLYGDSFVNDAGIYYFTTSTDLENWSSRKQVKTKERLRHGSAFLITDDKAKLKINKFILANNVIERNTKENGTPLSTLATNNVVSSLSILDEAIYTVSGSEKVTINAIANPNKAKRFFFYIASNTDASILIANGSGVVGVPNNTRYDAAFGEGDMMIEFAWVDAVNSFKPIVPNLKKFYDKKIQSIIDSIPSVPKPGGWKRVNLAAGTIDSLDVEDGVVYNVVGSDAVVINGLVSKPNGTHFYLLLSTGGSGTITVNSGSNITVPGGQFVMSVANGRNDRLFEFIKVDQTTFRLRQ